MKMTGNVTELTDRTFNQLINDSDKFVAVMFYTTSCPNCRVIAPVYDELSQELSKNAVFAKVNAQQNAGIASQYGIMGVPTFKFFCKNKPIGELVGAINTTILRNTIKDFIRHRNECVSKSTKISFELDGYG